MYSKHNQGNSVAAERFFRTLQNKIYKHLTSILKNRYIDKLADVINVWLSPSKKICCICSNETPLKMRKKAFYLILKALFFLKIFKFLSWLFGHVEKKGLIRNIRLISTFMTSQPGCQTVSIHILLNISQSKCNQTLKFGQLIEFSKTKILLWISYRKLGRKTSFRPLFVKKYLYEVKISGLHHILWFF